MCIQRILTLFLMFPFLLLTACAGKVSGRFDMQQRFASGVEVYGDNPN
jgi:hypothetical protein